MADMTKSGMGDLEITWAHDIETRDGKLTTDAQMVNAMVEKDSQGVCIVKRPGTSYYNPGGPVGAAQGNLFISGTLWWIVNDKLYQNGSPSVSITLPGLTVSGQNYFSVSDFPFGTSYLHNGVQMWKIVGTTPTLISGNPTPMSPGMAELDGVIYVMDTLGKVYGSALNDGTTWPALDFVQADYWLGQGRGLIRHLNYIIAYYNRGIQVYYDANSAPNGSGIALAPVLSASYTTGCPRGNTLQELADVTYFVAIDSEYGPSVKAMQGLQLTKVSTPYVDKILQETNLQLLFSASFRVAGHQFYLLQSASPAYTLVYDTEMQIWSTWQTRANTGLANFGGLYGATDGTQQFLQDTTSGLVMVLSPDTYTDAIGTIPVSCTTPNYEWGNLNYKRFSYMQQIAATTTTSINISFTDDDYQTFSTPRAISLQYPRKQLRNCGASRSRAWVMAHEDNTPLRLYAVKIAATILSR